VDAHWTVSWATAEDDGDCWVVANDIHLAAFPIAMLSGARGVIGGWVDTDDSMAEVGDDLNSHSSMNCRAGRAPLDSRSSKPAAANALARRGQSHFVDRVAGDVTLSFFPPPTLRLRFRLRGI
jgi:hypothetical protein